MSSLPKFSDARSAVMTLKWSVHEGGMYYILDGRVLWSELAIFLRKREREKEREKVLFVINQMKGIRS